MTIPRPSAITKSKTIHFAVFLWMLLLVASVLSGEQAIGQPFPLLHTFDDPTPTEADLFGHAAALAGTHALVGAYGDDTNGHTVGQAYLFDSTTGTLLHTFDDPTPTTRDWFGISVALGGNYALVGARWDDTNGYDEGQVHLFDINTGNLLHTFNDPTPTHRDSFGDSVALTGNYALIGAVGHNTDDEVFGQAHVFDLTTGTLLHTFEDPTPTNGDSDGFGSSVAAAGNYALVGASGDDTLGDLVGQAHLFDMATGNLLYTFDNPSPNRSDFFGNSVALSENYALVGAQWDDTNGNNAGQAYLFEISTGSLLHTFDGPTPTEFDNFGSSVALAGNYALVGAIGDDTKGESVGRAHLFDIATGNLLHSFDDPTPTDRDYFGQSVALADSYALIGASFADTKGEDVGQAHVFLIDPVPEPTSGLLVCFVLPLAAFYRARRKTRPKLQL